MAAKSRIKAKPEFGAENSTLRGNTNSNEPLWRREEKLRANNNKVKERENPKLEKCSVTKWENEVKKVWINCWKVSWGKKKLGIVNFRADQKNKEFEEKKTTSDYTLTSEEQ